MTTAATLTASGLPYLQPVILSGQAVSNAFVIPKNYQTVTIFTPLALALMTMPVWAFPGPVWKLQSTITYTGTVADTWSDVYAFDATMAAPTQLAFPFAASQALVLPAWYLGEGYARISTFDTVQPADTTFSLLFSGFYK